jgi:D-alanyl-D-alanine carboxypeptidase
MNNYQNYRVRLTVLLVFLAVVICIMVQPDIAVAASSGEVSSDAGTIIEETSDTSTGDTSSLDPESLNVEPFSAEPVVETTISGADESISRDYKKSVTDTVTITPAYGRPVELYLYNEDKKEWILKKTFLTEDSIKSEVEIRYPNNWKAHATSRWKIFVPEADAENSQNVVPAASAVVTTKLHNKFLSCKTAVAMVADSGEILYDLKKDKKRKVASITKLMTAVLLVENKKLSAKVRIRKSSINEVRPWQHGFHAGDSMSAKKAIYAMMIASANEVAAGTAKTVSGSKKAFVRKMNKRAKALGMQNTVYKNAHGLDVGKKHTSGNYSTAYDQALLARHIMTTSKLSFIRKAMKTKKKTIKSRKGKHTLLTTNEILGKNGCIGMKTGTEDKSGYCFTGAFRHKGKVYVTVVLGAKSESARWSNTRKLYSYAKYAAKHNIAPY